MHSFLCSAIYARIAADGVLFARGQCGGAGADLPSCIHTHVLLRGVEDCCHLSRCRNPPKLYGAYPGKSRSSPGVRVSCLPTPGPGRERSGAIHAWEAAGAIPAASLSLYVLTVFMSCVDGGTTKFPDCTSDEVHKEEPRSFFETPDTGLFVERYPVTYGFRTTCFLATSTSVASRETQAYVSVNARGISGGGLNLAGRRARYITSDHDTC